VVANAAVAFALLRGQPLETAACLLVIASALPFYLVFQRARAR
jgi:hypothetical protein